MPGPLTVGVVDAGSNSLHLQIVRGTPGEFESLSTARAQIQLGRLQDGALRPQAMDEAARVIAAWREQAQTLGCHAFRVFATAAVRDASNGQALGAALMERAGIPLHILSGEEEAIGVYRGARLGLKASHALVFDMGGRSTEFVLGRGSHVLFARSLSLGHLLCKEWSDSREQLERRTTQALSPLVAELVDFQPLPMAIATAGTAKTLVRIARRLTGDTGEPHGMSMDRHELEHIVHLLATTGESDALPGSDPRRRDTIFHGAVAMLQIMRELDLPRLTFSQQALREGLADILLEQTLESPC